MAAAYVGSGIAIRVGGHHAAASAPRPTRRPARRSIRLANTSNMGAGRQRSLLGREVRDTVRRSARCRSTCSLIAEDEEKAGALTEQGGEPALVVGTRRTGACGRRASSLLAGSAESSRKALQLAADPAAVVIDLTYAAEEHPAARLRAPFVEPARIPRAARRRCM